MNSLTSNMGLIVKKKAEVVKPVVKNPEADKAMAKARRYQLHRSCAPIGFAFKEPFEKL